MNDRPVFSCLSGFQWQWDNVHFEFLHPPKGNLSGNNASCVLLIRSGQTRVLLPGDIEQDTELSLIRQYRERLLADILVAPHHGSQTSSTMPFIRAVNPDYVVFTSGYLNRFGHPAGPVMTRYRTNASQVMETAKSGAIRFKITPGEGVTAGIVWRQQRRRFWSGEQE